MKNVIYEKLFILVYFVLLSGCSIPAYKPNPGTPIATLELMSGSRSVGVYAFSNTDCDKLDRGSLLANISARPFTSPDIEKVKIEAGKEFVFSFSELLDHGISVTRCTVTVQFSPLEGERYHAAFAGWPVEPCVVEMYTVHVDDDGSDYYEVMNDFTIRDKSCPAPLPW
ncbi:hypothetical protein ACJJI4_12165 [Microbulbifer sp. TRSA002]|uniref:hypothetical protein n=1 Tax=Microbulbifer sp. TRSA002 TaxID=3243382 RepID=UPI0040392F3F